MYLSKSTHQHFDAVILSSVPSKQAESCQEFVQSFPEKRYQMVRELYLQGLGYSDAGKEGLYTFLTSVTVKSAK